MSCDTTNSFNNFNNFLFDDTLDPGPDLDSDDPHELLR
jgi:hypothetical protein